MTRRHYKEKRRESSSLEKAASAGAPEKKKKMPSAEVAAFAETAEATTFEVFYSKYTANKRVKQGQPYLPRKNLTILQQEPHCCFVLSQQRTVR